jgi:Zn-dependent protease with chaperone function
LRRLDACGTTTSGSFIGWAVAAFMTPWATLQLLQTEGDWVAAYHPIESVPILLLVLIWCLGVVWPVSRWLISRNLTSLKVVLPVGLVAGWLASAGYVLVRYLAAWLGVRPILMLEVLPDRYGFWSGARSASCLLR